MKSSAVLQKIIFALEIVISLRILLFTIPVFMSTDVYSTGNMGSQGIIVSTVFAVLYLISGAVSFFKVSLGKILHYVSLIVVGAVTFLNKPVDIIPSGLIALAALVLTLTITFLKTDEGVGRTQ
jgi:hypothetical protein